MRRHALRKCVSRQCTGLENCRCTWLGVDKKVPAQMCQSPPQCLWIRKPAKWSSCDGDGFDRYNHLLHLYIEEMKKLEVRMNTNSEDSFTRCMRQSMSNGKFWFPALMESCYEGDDCCSPWKALRKWILDVDKRSCPPESCRRAFVAKKVEDLATYTALWEAMQAKMETEKGERSESWTTPSAGFWERVSTTSPL